MRASRSHIRDKILLVLDKGPCHGYDLLSTLNEDFGGIRLTTLYRWLHDMEAEGLVVSEMQPGPHGPSRRVYEVGARGETRLREILKDAIGVVLHFYEAYRHSITDKLEGIIENREKNSSNGRLLFTAVPRVTEYNLRTIQVLAERINGSQIDIMGDPTVAGKSGVRFRHVQGDLCDIPSPNKRYSEVWVCGVPEKEELSRAIMECKRVLSESGMLYIIAPFAYFSEPEEPGLGEFIRVTAVQLFPDLGVTEGDEVGDLLGKSFENSGMIDVFPGLALFWASDQGVA